MQFLGTSLFFFLLRVDKKFILIYYSSADRKLSVRQFMALFAAY